MLQSDPSGPPNAGVLASPYTVPLVQAWNDRSKFVRGRDADALYEHLVTLRVWRKELTEFKALAAHCVRLVPSTGVQGVATVALAQIVEVVNSLLLLEGREEDLAWIPPAERPQPKTGTSLLGSASLLHSRWVYQQKQDYSRAEKDEDFRTRKREAIERMVDLVPKAEREVIALNSALELIPAARWQHQGAPAQPGSPSEANSDNSATARPILKVEQLPAKVLVTLLDSGGSALALELHLKHTGAGKKEGRRLANLLTPKGDLAKRQFVTSSDGVVTLTPAGREEAEKQARRGTKPLGDDTHD
jgi:hypothetical protein